MNRNKFISLVGLSFIGTTFFAAKKRPAVELTDCNDPITPPVPEGPYYKNEHLNRINITENKKGVPLEYLLKVEDKNCKPIPGAIVDIWQCDADGHYSDFDKEGTANQTWLRGFQKTNERGECTFTSIFPGWYTGRLTHVHAKVIINGAAVLTTNFFFKKEIENGIHQLPLYPKGPNPVTMQEDFELRNDKTTERRDTLVMQVAKDNSGKLVAKYTIAIV